MRHPKSSQALNFIATAPFQVFFWITALYLFLGQGLVLWDDDYGLWQHQLIGLGWFDLVVRRLFSPFPYTDSSWGFTERALQLFVYKLLFAVSPNYFPLPFFAFKSLSLGLLGALLWVLMRELGTSTFARFAALLLIFTAPNTLAAFTWHADFAPTAEFLYVAALLAFVRLFCELPQAPLKKLLGDRARLCRWGLLIILVYLSYKSKANLKLLPFIFLAATIYLRPSALKFVAIPCAVLLLLALPWSKTTFTSLPPWFPGSGGSKVSWMYQESGGAAKALSLIAAIPEPKSALSSPDFYPLSLLEILGVFLLLLLLLGLSDYLLGNKGGRDSITTQQRTALTVVILWFLAELAGSTALSDINYFFRIRYGFILIVPLCALIAVVLTRIGTSQVFQPKWLERLVLIVIALVLFYQVKLNFVRGIQYRSALGGVMASIDQAYRYIDSSLPGATLLLFPGFRSYAPPVDAAPSLQNRRELASLEAAKTFPPLDTYGLSWGDKPIEGFSIVKSFTGCTSPRILNIAGQCEAPLSLYRKN